MTARASVSSSQVEESGFSFRKVWWLPIVALLLLLFVVEMLGNITAQATMVAPARSEVLEVTSEFSGGSFVFHCTPDPNSTADAPRSFWSFTADFFNVNGKTIASNGGNAPHNGGCPPGPQSETDLVEFILSLLRGDASLVAKYESSLYDIAVEVAKIIIRT